MHALQELGSACMPFRKAPKVDSSDLPQYGEQAISILMAHYGAEKPAETLLGEPTNREAVISSDITTEWKTYRQLLVNMHEKSMKLQLKELVSNDMMRTLFPNLSKIATISPCLNGIGRKKLFPNEANQVPLKIQPK